MNYSWCWHACQLVDKINKQVQYLILNVCVHAIHTYGTKKSIWGVYNIVWVKFACSFAHSIYSQCYHRFKCNEGTTACLRIVLTWTVLNHFRYALTVSSHMHIRQLHSRILSFPYAYRTMLCTHAYIFMHNYIIYTTFIMFILPTSPAFKNCMLSERIYGSICTFHRLDKVSIWNLLLMQTLGMVYVN